MMDYRVKIYDIDVKKTFNVILTDYQIYILKELRGGKRKSTRIRFKNEQPRLEFIRMEDGEIDFTIDLKQSDIDVLMDNDFLEEIKESGVSSYFANNNAISCLWRVDRRTYDKKSSEPVNEDVKKYEKVASKILKKSYPEIKFKSIGLDEFWKLTNEIIKRDKCSGFYAGVYKRMLGVNHVTNKHDGHDETIHYITKTSEIYAIAIKPKGCDYNLAFKNMTISHV